MNDKNLENIKGLEVPSLDEVKSLKIDSEKMGKPIKFRAHRDTQEIDRPGVIEDNIEFVFDELKKLKAVRKAEGKTAFNEPVVFYAAIVKNVSDYSVTGGYVIRIGSLKAQAGQGHVTAIRRIVDLGHLVVGHDLPTIEAFSEMQIKNGASDAEEFIKRFAELKKYVEELMEIAFNKKQIKDLQNEKTAMQERLEASQKEKEELAKQLAEKDKEVVTKPTLIVPVVDKQETKSK